MKVVPQAFFESKKFETLLKSGQNSLIHKVTSEADIDNERWLSSTAITLVISGGLHIHTDDGIPVKVKENELVVLPKGLYMITDLIPRKKPFEAYVLFLEDDLINKFRFKPRDTDKQLLFVQKNESISKALWQNGINDFEKLKLLLSCLTENNPDLQSALALAMIRLKRSIPSLMLAHFQKPLRVEDFAEISGRSISSFRREFHLKFGISPKKWLIEKRLELASQKLKEASSVSTVALEVGFTDIPHFTKSFQKKYQLSPSKFLCQG